MPHYDYIISVLFFLSTKYQQSFKSLVNCSLLMQYKNLNVLFTVPSATVRRCNQQKETMKQEFVFLQPHSLSPQSFFFF